MPFINLTYEDAIEILNNPSYITTLLKQKKINFKEAHLLELVCQIAEGQKEKIDELKELTQQYFADDWEQAIDRLLKYALSENKQVPWILFSRTFQFIPYDEGNPFELYRPGRTKVIHVTIRK